MTREIALSGEEMLALGQLVGHQFFEHITPILEKLGSDPRDDIAVDDAYDFAMGAILGATVTMLIDAGADPDLIKEWSMRAIDSALKAIKNVSMPQWRLRRFGLDNVLEALSTQSGAWLLVMRLGDCDQHAPGAPRQFMIAGEGHGDPKLRDVVGEWFRDTPLDSA